ncbi:MAG: hypothetical protein ACRBB3_04695 [Alphaproteobacteria bacterium]
MAYIASDLSVLAYANNFTLWHFTTEDADITTSGYFNSAVDMLRTNDLIIANIDTDGSPSTTFYVVTGNDGNTVSISAYA